MTKKNTVWLHWAIIIVAIVAAYGKVFGASFTIWDDYEYVVHNKDITSFSFIGHWFSSFYIGNYHPLTILSYAIDYLIGGNSPFIYHVTNIALHTATALVIYTFINKLQASKTVALFVTLIFALHPSQTETVSWIAERKTVLCGFFLFTSLLMYVRYIDRPTTAKLLLVYTLATAAMLSKGVGVAAPVSMFAVDIWRQRKITWKNTLEKVPLILAGIMIGIVAIKAQAYGKFLNLHPEYSWAERIVYAGYAYTEYIVHFFAPAGLSVIYPYPRQLGFVHYFFVAVSAGILVLGIIAYRKRWMVLCGGIVFYTVNIALVLQFVQFGEFLMADRYLYIACIGFIYPFVYYLFAWLQKKVSRAAPAIAGTVVAAILMVVTFVHNDIWLSEFNFFSSILEAFPHSAVAQYSVGALYIKEGKYDSALVHINFALQEDPENYKAWYDKGVLYMRQGNVPGALQALNQAIALNGYRKALFSRALLYQQTSQPEKGLADIDRVLADEPQNGRAYYIKADCLDQLGRTQESLDNFNKAIQYESTDAFFFIKRGVVNAKLKQYNEAMSDLNAAVQMQPGSGEAWYYRGVVKYRAGLQPCSDFQQAVQLGFRPAADALNKLCH